MRAISRTAPLPAVVLVNLFSLVAINGCASEDDWTAPDGVSIVQATVKDPDPVCLGGVIVIARGEDRNGNGKLEGKEIKALEHICLVSAGAPLVSVFVTTEDAAGGVCPAGGKVLRWGHDLDRDGQLSAGEVQGSTTVCHGRAGRDGLVSIVSTMPEPPGSVCAAGGSVFRSGLDHNGNGALDPGEVASTAYVCNGKDGARGGEGASGPAGDAGAPGVNTLVALDDEPPGANCPAGGVRVRSGLDLDRDGTLDDEETTQSKYVCHGVSAADAGVGDGPPETGGADAEDPRLCGVTGPYFDEGRVPAREVHVSPEGDDDTGDGSAGAPFASFHRAKRELGPGDALRVHGGTYDRGVALGGLSGTPQRPIWVTGASSTERSILRTTVGVALVLSQSSYIVVQDLGLVGPTGALTIDDEESPGTVHHIIVRRVTATGDEAMPIPSCVRMFGAVDFALLDSELRYCGQGVRIMGGRRGLVAGNVIRDTTTGLELRAGIVGVEVRRNHIVGATRRGLNLGGDTGPEFFHPPLSPGVPGAEARNVRAIANVIQDSNDNVAFAGCVDCSVINNSFVNPIGRLILIAHETTPQPPYEVLPPSGGQIINNLFLFGDEATRFVPVHPPWVDASSFVFANNAWFNQDDPSASAPVLPVPESQGLVGQDPLLGPDLRPAAASPLIGRGRIVPAAPDDFVGACYRSPPTIGAHEVSP